MSLLLLANNSCGWSLKFIQTSPQRKGRKEISTILKVPVPFSSQDTDISLKNWANLSPTTEFSDCQDPPPLMEAETFL